MYHVEAEHEELCTRVKADQLLSQWKKSFVERRVFKDPPVAAEIDAMDPDVLESAYRAVVDTLQPDAALSADPERELAEVSAALQRAVDEKQEGADEQIATVRAWTRALAFHPALARRRQAIASFHVPHKTEYADLKTFTEGQFGGLGIVISVRDNYPTVISPVEGTPAYSLGVQSGDVIIKINNLVVKEKGLTAKEVEAAGNEIIKQKPGDKIKLTVKRASKEHKLEVTVGK